MAELGQLRALVAHEVSRRWRSLLVWGVALGGLGALYVALYPSMKTFMEQYLEQAPENMRRFLGELRGPLTAEQWLGMEFLDMLLPVALPFLVITMGARALAGREERKTLDLLLGNPLARRQLVVSSLLTMAASLALVLAVTWVISYLAVAIVGVELGAGRLASALAALWPMCLLFGALALLLSALVRRSAIAIAVPAVVLIAMYVVEALAQVSKTMEPVRIVSFFYHLGSPIQGDFPWTTVLAMLGGVCLLGLCASIAFERRDLYT